MRHIDPPGYRHEALFYRGDEEFLAGTVPLVRDAVAADAAVLVAVPRPRSHALREALGRDGERVSFAEMEELGRNPGRIIGAWRDFIRRARRRRREAAAGSASRSGPSAPRPSSSSASATRRC